MFIRGPEKGSVHDRVFGRDMKLYTRLTLLFVALQAADVITTLVVLRLGGAELNSLVAGLMIFGSAEGLLVSKLIVLVLAFIAVWTLRYRVLRWANIAFTAIVAWNLSIIVRLILKQT